MLFSGSGTCSPAPLLDTRPLYKTRQSLSAQFVFLPILSPPWKLWTSSSFIISTPISPPLLKLHILSFALVSMATIRMKIHSSIWISSLLLLQDLENLLTRGTSLSRAKTNSVSLNGIFFSPNPISSRNEKSFRLNSVRSQSLRFQFRFLNQHLDSRFPCSRSRN